MSSEPTSPSSEEFQIIDDILHSRQDSQEEITFNSTTRDIILISCVCMIIYSLMLKQIHHYLHKKELSQRHIDERIIRTVSAHACAFSLTTTLFFIIILPVSMISNEILLAATACKNKHKYCENSSWYLQWLSTELFSTLWTCISISSIISSFVFLPFCYFFLESEATISKTTRISDESQNTFHVKKTHQQDDRDRYINYIQHLCNRFLQTLVIFVLFFGILALLTAIFTQFRDIWRLPNLFFEGFTVINLFLLLISAPQGFRNMFEKAQQLLEKPIYSLKKESTIFLIQTEIDSLERKLEMKPDEEIKLKLKNLMSKKSIFIKNVSFWKKLVYPLVVLMLIILPIFSILISGYHVLEILYTEKIKTIKNTNWMTMLFFNLLEKLYFLDGRKQSGNKKLGVSGLSFFGPIGTIVEALLVPYLYISSVYGFYTWAVFKKLRPVKSESSLHLMIINSFIVLSLSSALPLLCRILDFVEPHETINPSDFNTGKW